MMNEKNHRLPLSAVWNQLDSCLNEQPRNPSSSTNSQRGPALQRNHTSSRINHMGASLQRDPASSRNDQEGASLLRNPVLSNSSISRNDELEDLLARPHDRPRSDLSGNKGRSGNRTVEKNSGNTSQKHHPNRRNNYSRQCKSTSSIVPDNRTRNNIQSGAARDEYQFPAQRRENMQRERTRDNNQFYNNRNNRNQQKGCVENRNTYTDHYEEAKPISFLTLQELVTKHPNEILLSINKKKGGFMILIRREIIKPDTMALILIALGKACTATLLNQNVSALLNAVSSFKNVFVMSIQTYLISLRLNLVQEFHLQSLQYLSVFLQKFQQTLPSSSSEMISILLPLLIMKCETFLKTHESFDDVMKRLKEINEENEHFLAQHTVAEIKKASYREAMQLCEPPENFRSLSVLPNVDDIHTNAFLRPNIVEGKYTNTEQYLDIQYRLLREDYVKPLRDGIADYLMLKKAGKSVKKCRDIRVYENVRIVKQDFVNGGIVHIAEFYDEKFATIKWEYSKRFLSGSLLCLSSDNFQTMLFASVAQRLPEQLKKGLLLLRFEDISDEILNLNALRQFVVIETSAYFEAYRHNLKALQELNEQTLPFKKYIVNVENTVECPEYLKVTTTYDMRPLLIPIDDIHIKRIIGPSGEVSIQYEYPADITGVYKSIPILNDAFWPSASSLSLDDSQYLALKAAVTKEFAVIQGPPGTGKTFIGLRIVQLFLHNIDKWFLKERNSLPILVVCFTNHALDQFLEGVMRFTDKIVRIGGRGTNEAVSSFQLNNLRRNAVTKKEIPKYISSSIWHKNHELKILKTEIDNINHSIHMSLKVVFGEKDLMSAIPSVHYDSLRSILKHPYFLEHNLADDGQLIHDWLGIRTRGGWSEPEVFEVKEVKQQVKNESPVPETTDIDDVDNDSIGEGDIEFIEAQRDIDSEEFAGVSFEIEVPEKEEFILPDDSGWHVQGGRKQRLKLIKNWLYHSQPLEESKAMQIRNVWTLDIPKRWQLYKFWLGRLIADKQEECITKQILLKQHFKEICEMRREEDVFVLQKAHVVGMTTTGAAKYRDIVLRLNPQILVVEEAAEILESHIVTSLAPNTQHVILIGDHQQLRPSPTVHMLAVKYDLNISLFERMIKNKMDCFRLSIQHRMRPEVAELIVPHIYSDLKNHEDVTKYENIKGVNKNVFFVTHNYSELQENDSKSRVNNHEAKFLIRLCKYFVLQGYDPSQITVLTTYTGQLFVLKKLMTDVIRKVRFTVVDNFQGEENDIILISFVRSNEEGNIGFLKIANRVCVALSRAKKGLFCIGNFELLAEKSDLWKGIVNTLQKNQSIGPSLQLVCQNHPGVCNVVASEKDFESVPEGGCTRVCEYRLVCGHACSLMCHPYDREHENVRCQKQCNKTCEFGHQCKKKCSKKCGPCVELVDKKVVKCGHTIKIHCHMRNSEVKCTAKCEKTLPLCGHRCSNMCSEVCAGLCTEKISIKSPICGHMVAVECRYKNQSEKLMSSCSKPCNTCLDCGHNCKGTCYSCHQGRLHVACNQPCKRILVCGHECKALCAKSCPPCKVPCENKCIHSKCPKKCGEPCEMCTEACEWHCEHQSCSRTCGEICDRKPCNKPCLRRLSCGHPCIGFCGEPCPKECRQCDEEKVKEIFFGTEDEEDSRFVRLEDCNHILEVSGLSEWMKVDGKSDHQIQMKVCPKCKTVIRTNLRFGNTVKDCLRKIENVKRKTFGNVEDNMKMQKKLLKYLHNNSPSFNRLVSDSLYNTWEKILSSKKCRSIQEITTLENIFRVSLQLADIVQYLRTCSSYKEEDPSAREGLEVLFLFMNSSKEWLINFIKDDFLTASDQQLQQLTWETHRLHLGMKLMKLVKLRLQKPSSDFENCISVLTKYSPFGDNDVKSFSTSYQNLARTFGTAVINLSELEKQSILKAMNLAKGHWYQCPNGHVYCITECGGAMEKGRCNECNEVIGGANHTLVSNNRVATDMDGARHAAWSDAMNIGNFHIDLNDDDDDDLEYF